MKKVLILTSTGGGGHMSVSNALKQYLEDDYETEEVLLFKHILKSLDPVMSTIFGRFNGENIYNYFMRKKFFMLANLLYNIGEYYFTFRSRKIRSILEYYFTKKKPDLIISVIPIINQDVFLVTKKLGIPFLLVPTDLDATTFLHRIDGQDHPHFKLSLAFDDGEIRKAAEKNGINPETISISGFPLRADFFKEKNNKKIKKNFNLPHNKPSILLLMGTQGSHDMQRFVKELAQLAMPAHLICCIGKSESLKTTLTSIELPEYISLSIIGFTQQIADLMAVTDLIITKSGSVSVCETMYSNKPTLLDATSTVLRWERFNHHFFKKHNIGGIISADIPIAQQIKTVLTDKKLLKSYQNNLLALEKNQPHLDIPELIKQMLEYTPEKEKQTTRQKEKQTSGQEACFQLSLSSTVRHK